MIMALKPQAEEQWFSTVECPLVDKPALRALESLSPEAEGIPPSTGELHKLSGITAGLTWTDIFIFSRY